MKIPEDSSEKKEFSAIVIINKKYRKEKKSLKCSEYHAGFTFTK